MSKFSKIFDAAQGDEPEKKPEQPQPEPVSIASPPANRRGRPRGKRSDPDYEQVTAYIRRNTHQQVKISLLQEGNDRQFSELVEELLQEWLRSNN